MRKQRGLRAEVLLSIAKLCNTAMGKKKAKNDDACLQCEDLTRKEQTWMKEQYTGLFLSACSAVFLFNKALNIYWRAAAFSLKCKQNCQSIEKKTKTPTTLFEKGFQQRNSTCYFLQNYYVQHAKPNYLRGKGVHTGWERIKLSCAESWKEKYTVQIRNWTNRVIHMLKEHFVGLGKTF